MLCLLGFGGLFLGSCGAEGTASSEKATAPVEVVSVRILKGTIAGAKNRLVFLGEDRFWYPLDSVHRFLDDEGKEKSGYFAEGVLYQAAF